MNKNILVNAFVLFVAASLLTPATKQAVQAADKTGGQIVFVSCRNFVKNLIAADCGLSIMNADGSGLRQLTDGLDDMTPSLSPDGKKVAFSSFRRDGNYEIYVINTDGTNLTRVTNRKESDVAPDWSPDGKKIAFAGGLEGGDPNKYYIFSMNADGSDVKQLTNSNGILPRWFSDEKLVYISLHNKVGDIMEKNVTKEGFGAMGIKSVPAMSVNPAVMAPDGKQIAFLSQKSDADAIGLNITTEAKGWNDMVLLTEGFRPIFGGLSWSPDGKKLIFSMHGDGKSMNGGSRLYLINADGSGLEPFPLECLFCYGADWGINQH
jgi:Tol biopolymer transport system component